MGVFRQVVVLGWSECQWLHGIRATRSWGVRWGDAARRWGAQSAGRAAAIFPVRHQSLVELVGPVTDQPQWLGEWDSFFLGLTK